MFWGLLLAALGALLAFSREGGAYAFTGLKLSLIASGVAVAWYWRSGQARNWKLAAAAVLFLASLVVPTILSTNHWMSLVGYRAVFSGSVLTSILCALGMVLADRLDGKQRGNLKKAILCAGVVNVIAGVCNLAGRDPLSFGPVVSGRPLGFIGSTINYGAMMVLLWTVEKNPLFLLGALMTPNIGTGLGVLVASLPTKIRLAGFVLITLGAVVFVPFSERPSDIERTAVWKVALRPMSILHGVGPAAFSESVKAKLGRTDVMGNPEYATAHAHNAILNAWACCGVFGLVGLLSFLVAPEMAGLWTISMFNPISFEVVFIACLLVGIRKHETGAALA